MASESDTARDAVGARRNGPEAEEAERLRGRLEALEAEHAAALARAHAAVAKAQDRSYWLDRWGLDLNALMRVRGAAQARAAFRALRVVGRAGIRARRALRNATATRR